MNHPRSSEAVVAHPEVTVIRETVVGAKVPYEARMRERLGAQLGELATLAAGWDGEGAPAPGAGVQESARRVVEMILSGSVDAAPHLAPARDGGVLFDLTGILGRQVDLWIEPEDPTVLHYTTEDAGGSIPMERFGTVLEWLAGRGELG